MKEKKRALVEWGRGTYNLLKTNSLVLSAAILVQGLFFLILPEHSIMLDAVMVSLLMAIYSAVSLVFVLTDRPKAAKGKKVAGDLVKGYVDRKKRSSEKEQEILPEDSVMKEYTANSGKRKEALGKRVLDIHERSQNVSRIVMAVFYAVVLAVAVILLIDREAAVHLNHIIVGLLLIADGVLSIISAVSANDRSAYKNYRLSIALAICSIILGALYIVASAQTAVIVKRILGAALILKAIGEFVVAYRNRKL